MNDAGAFTREKVHRPEGPYRSTSSPVPPRSLVKTEINLRKVWVKVIWADSKKLRELQFGGGPEALDPLDVRASFDQFVVVLDTQMFEAVNQ